MSDKPIAASSQPDVMKSTDPALMTSSKRARSTSPARFLVLSLVFHLVYISSIFDIYFTSPVVHPEPRFSVASTLDATSDVSKLEAPARRLVLIVGDGLRADTLFKRHPSVLLPAWATLDPDRFPLSGDGHGWDRLQDDPVDSAYPFEQALNPYRSDADLVGQVPTSAFAGPFLRNVAQHRGVWGISHTRVPTESRPGHVAMIAGMYEDVSAVTKGWKLNPIAFDSILNQSSHSYAFGSPDIVPMFAVGAAVNRVDMWTYKDDEEDFTKDATHLDLWVLNQLTDLFARARVDDKLRAKMQRPGTVFFLHLLGLDTTGHFSRPLSPEYVGNTIVVDAIAQKVERMMDDFFHNDGRTAYVFTADHGMSHKGNHGDGHPDNTRTPILAWGAGVRTPDVATAAQKRQSSQEREEDEAGYYNDWNLDDVARVDIDQADITPLMATLVGVPVPANSEGRLRVDMLQVSDEHKARALLANAQQVLETYRVKHLDRARRMIRFVPFRPLQQDTDGMSPGQDRVVQIQSHIRAGDYRAAIDRSNELIDLAIQGAYYLQTYDWLLLCSLVTIGYIGFIVYSIAFLLRTYMLPAENTPPSDQQSLPRPNKLKLLMAPVSGALFAIFAAQDMPISYYLYAALAVFFWARVVGEQRTFSQTLQHVRQSSHPDVQSYSYAKLLLNSIGAIGLLELIVVGYLHRTACFVGFILIGFAWPSLTLDADFKSENEGVLLLWGLMCLATGSFTISDVNKEESILLLVFSALLFLTAGLAILSRPELFLGPSTATGQSDAAQTSHIQRALVTLKFQLVVLVVTTVTTVISARSLQRKNGLPLTSQIVAWICLLICFIFPFAFGFCRPVAGVAQPQSQRLTIVIFAFAPVFVLLSLRDEVLFFGVYTVALLVWAKLEGTLYEHRLLKMGQHAHVASRSLQLADLRISLFFLFFLHVGFFGTGNVASISSFYLSPVYRLVPVFSPFLMATLLLVKILVPFLILNAVFQTMCATPPNYAALQRASTTSSSTRTTASDRGMKLLGSTAPGGLALESSLSLVFGACIAADVLALNFLYAVKSQGSWLEIGQTITHFVMANLLQIFMLGLAAVSSALLHTTTPHSSPGKKQM